MSVTMAAVLAVGLAAAGPVDLDAAKKESAAAAQAWLGLVDAGNGEEAWKAASPTFRSGMTREDWNKKSAGWRDSLGPVAGRKPTGATFSETLPGAPDAHYVLVTYSTDFAKKKGATETVIAVKEGGGWKVAGYRVE